MIFHAALMPVLNRGHAPLSFLTAIVDWAIQAPDEIFAPNPNPNDVYSLIRPVLGPWTGLPHRRAAMMEVMRVHAGFESSWRFSEGVDTTNKTSMRHIEGAETGVFQVSFDSTRLGNSAMLPYAVAHGIGTPQEFIDKMKSSHELALDYYARLVRVNIAWAGPLVRHEILPILRRDAVQEFQQALAG